MTFSEGTNELRERDEEIRRTKKSKAVNEKQRTVLAREGPTIHGQTEGMGAMEKIGKPCDQRDQIWRNFAILAQISKSL